MLTTCKGIVSISYIEQHTDIVKHERQLANMVVIVRNVVGIVYLVYIPSVSPEMGHFLRTLSPVFCGFTLRDHVILGVPDH